MCVLCLVVDCGHPGNISNGRVRVSGSTLERGIHYSCDMGYILKGSLWRTCQSNGTWSGLKPTCEGEYHFEWNHKTVDICICDMTTHKHTL